jgi:nucleoid-associated protein EbfC
MLPNIPGIGNLQKQVQKMQEDMARLQDDLAAERLETTAGGGMVKVITTGAGDILEIKIAPEAVDPSDVEMLEDLVVTAVRDAIRKAQDNQTQKMSAIAGPFAGKMPGLF